MAHINTNEHCLLAELLWESHSVEISSGLTVNLSDDVRSVRN